LKEIDSWETRGTRLEERRKNLKVGSNLKFVAYLKYKPEPNYPKWATEENGFYAKVYVKPGQPVIRIIWPYWLAKSINNGVSWPKYFRSDFPYLNEMIETIGHECVHQVLDKIGTNGDYQS